MPDNDAVWRALLLFFTKVAPFYIAIALYGRWKRKFIVVVSETAAPLAESTSKAAAEEKGVERASEKPATLNTADQDVEQADVANLKSLMIWATVMLPFNLAACYSTICYWANLQSAAVSDSLYPLYHSIVASMPASAAIHILLSCCFLTVCKSQARAEKLHELIRSALLDGVIMSPLASIWLVFLYPGKFANGGIWTWIGVTAYASQAVVWLRFFLWSQGDSRGMAPVRPMA